VILTTKIWNDLERKALPGFASDLLLLHWPNPQETLGAVALARHRASPGTSAPRISPSL
jgi:hypothetical protein